GMFLCSRSEFVDKTRDDINIVRRTYASPKRRWNCCRFYPRKLNPLVGNCIRKIDGPIHPIHIDAILEEWWSEAGHDRRSRDPVGPRQGHSCTVKTGGYAVIVVGSIHIVLDVFLAAPNDLDRIVQLRRDEGRLHDEVEFKPSSETTAQQVVMNAHLFNIEPKRVRDGLLRSCRNLSTNPDIAAVRSPGYRTVNRLHRCMRKKWRFICGFDLLSAPGKCHHSIAFIFRHSSRRLRCFG